MELSFRPATADDADACRDLVHSAAPELYEYMFTRRKVSARDYIVHEFQMGVGFVGHRIHTVVEAAGEIVGVAAFYTSEQFPHLQTQSGKEILRFYSLWDVVPVMRHASHSQSLVRRPLPRSVYVANLGVHPRFRGHGVGTALLAHETDKARAAGYASMTLDVADNNPRAEALYRRLGFRFVEEKRFRGDRDATIPNCKLLKLSIR